MASEKMRYLLVLGTQRTGKTLMGRALNMHPKIVVQVEPYFYFFKLCRNIFYRDILKRSDFDPESPMDTLFCRPDGEKRLFSESFQKLQFSRSDTEELIRLTIQQQEVSKGERAVRVIPLLGRLKPGSSVSVFISLMDILYESYAKEGAAIIGLTEGWCDEFIKPLLSLKDLDIRVIHCLRDVRSIVASRNGGSRLHTGKYPLLFIIRHWRKAIAYSILHEGDPRYMAVRYEDLVQEPESHFTRICEFLGVPFDRELLNIQAYVKGDGTPWKRNSAFEVPLSHGFSKSSIARWKEILSREEIGVIEYLCGPEMGYLGFTRSIPDFSLQELLRFREDEGAIVPWLQKYKLTCSEREMALEIARKNIVQESRSADAEWLIDYLTINKDVAKKILRAGECHV